ncbi:MAG: hypothetical protein MI922_24235, partial [Bacteroidales bacterium]|nr:hypothetical protein [Bacteroidales bacterium]
VKTYKKERKNYDKNKYYVFLIPNSNKAGLYARMPLTSNFGFFFTNNLTVADKMAHTLAHELGHGAFHLYHTFSDKNEYTQTRGNTDNLMDYDNNLGTHLYKYQWDLVHDPEKILFAFMEDETESETMEGLLYKIEEQAKALGLKLGENAFATVHTFNCQNIGDIQDNNSFDLSNIKNIEVPGSIQPSYMFLQKKGDKDVVNIVIIFRIEDGHLDIENLSSIGNIHVGMEPPFLGVQKESGTLIECPNQLSLLDDFGCVNDNSLMAKFFKAEYRTLYVTHMLSAIDECLNEQDIDESDNKVGDYFYTEYLQGATTEKEIKQLRQVADLFNNIGNLLHDKNDKNTWNEVGEFYKAKYDAYKATQSEKPFEDFLEDLQSILSDYQHRKEMLEKFNNRESVMVIVNTFTNTELEYLPMKLRAHSLNVMASKELRGLVRLSGRNEEELVLRLLKYIKSEEVPELITELKKGDLLNTMDKGFNDLLILVEDNYAKLLDILDKYILTTNKIVDDNTKANKLVELHEKNRFYNLTGDDEGKEYISASNIISEGKVTFTVSKVTGTRSVFVHMPDGGYYKTEKIIESNKITIPFDNPVALYHNAYLDGVDASKIGQIELASALKLHYYLQCNTNEDIKTTISVVVDVGSMAIGLGAITKGIKGVRLVLALCDVASSTISLISTGMEKHLIDKYGADGQAYVNSMQMISAVLGFVDLGATQVNKLRQIMEGDIVTVGAFYSKYSKKLLADSETKELAKQTKKLIDEFTEYDAQIARLIDNVEDIAESTRYIDELVELIPANNPTLRAALRTDLENSAKLLAAIKKDKTLIDAWKDLAS